MKLLSTHSATRFAGVIACAFLALGSLTARAALSDGLVGYWPFDTDLEDKSESDPPAHGVGKTWTAGGADNLDGLAANAVAEATYVEGKFGQSVKFADDFYVETPVELEDRFDFGSIVNAGAEDEDDPDEAPDRPGFTVSAWITVDEFTTGWQCIAGKGEDNQWRIHRRAETNMITGNGGNGDTPEGSFEAEPGSGTWHHIVLRSDLENDMASFWVDGEISAENSGLNPEGNIMPMLIGQNPDTGNRTWKGNIDDFATWNRPLTDDEIAELWNGGDGVSVETALDPSDPNVSGAKSVVLKDVLPEIDETFAINIGNTGDTQPLVISNVTLSGPDMANFTIVDSPSEIAPESRSAINMIFNGGQSLGTFNATVTYTTNDPDPEDQTVEVALTALVPNSEGPEAHYRFDETDAAEAAVDSTTNLRAGAYDAGNGTIDLSVAGLSGADGTAFSVSGGGSVEAPNFPAGDFTVSLFFQPDSLGDAGASDLRTLFGQGENSPEFGLLEASGALHWFGEETILFSTDTIIEVGTTYHVAMTYDAAAQTAAIILDGVEVATDTVAAPGPDGPFYIGAFGTSNALGFDGTIDDLQFYSRVLSADEEISFLRENPGQVLTPFALGQDPDSDLDGLSDKLELSEYMTDPQNPDTDDDGVNDGDEIANNLNPLVSDTDGDGFLDGADEAPLDPNVPDLNDFLIVHYDFNEGVGTEIGNKGSAGPGELTNAHNGAWVSAGAPDGSGYLNFLTEGAGETAQFVRTGLEGPDNNPFLGEVDYTAMAWVRYDTVATGGNDNDKMIFGQVVDDNVLHLGARGGGYKFGHWGNDTDGGTIAVDEWRHVAFRYQGGEQSIIVDGETVASSVKGPLAVDAEIVIGSARAVDDRDMSGDLDDIRIYSAGLSNAAITKIIAEAGDPDADTDGDGLRDGYELETFGNLDQTGDGDPDEDGLTNLQEIAEGTDPTVADTDGDSVNDGDEIADSTSPLTMDTDGDGLTDGDEKTRGTTPTSPDTDGDGFADGVEVANDYDPLSADSPDSAVIAGLIDEVGDAVVQYDFDEGSGTDISNGGTGGPGVLTNPHAGAWVAEGGVNNSAYLNFSQDGETGVEAQYVDTGLDESSINIANGAYTMEAWVRADATAPGANAGDGMIFGQLDAGNVLHNGLRDGSFHIGHWGSDTTGGTVSAGEWQHVAYRFADGVQTIFVDGVQAVEGVDKVGVTVAGNVVIGAARGDQNRDFSGDLDNIRIYNSSLTGLQISALSANGVPVDTVNPGGGDRPPSISDVFLADGGALSFGFPAGTTYNVEYSTDLINWSVVASDVTGTYTETDAARNGELQGYYRGVAQ